MSNTSKRQLEQEIGGGRIQAQNLGSGRKFCNSDDVLKRVKLDKRVRKVDLPRRATCAVVDVLDLLLVLVLVFVRVAAGAGHGQRRKLRS